MKKEALTKKGKSIFERIKISDFIDEFYLAGGTGLALQLGHRVSVDFDFFSENKIEDTLLDVVDNNLKEKSLKINVNNIGELTVVVDGVKITFLHYPFPIVTETVDLEGVECLSVKEIAATKAYSLGRRGEYKDYVDLYFLLKEKLIDLREIIEISEKKYGGKFNGKLFLEQLLYKEDVEEMNINLLKKDVKKEEIFNFLKNKVTNFSI